MLSFLGFSDDEKTNMELEFEDIIIFTYESDTLIQWLKRLVQKNLRKWMLSRKGNFEDIYK